LHAIHNALFSLSILVLVVSMVGWLAWVQPAYAQVELKPSSLCNKDIKKSLTLTADLICSTPTGIGIGANGITLNCNNHIIKHTGPPETGDGIVIAYRSHVTVKHCTVENFYYAGIYVYRSSNVVVSDNSVSGNGLTGLTGIYPPSVAGIELNEVSSTTVIGNVANGNENGFSIYANHGTSSNNIIQGNSAGFGSANVLYGFYDGTTGSGTAGTANTYTGNSCSGTNNGGGAQSSPTGLC